MVERYIIYLHKDAEKALLKIPKAICFRVQSAIDQLQNNPTMGIKMNGKLSHLRKIKIANYRIIYQIIELKLIIEIIEIESRGNVFYDR